MTLAGVIAPVVRRGAERAAQRRVTTLDREGKPVRQVTLVDVQKGVLDAADLHFDVDHRPERLICTRCRKVLKVPKTGPVRKLCKTCGLRTKHEKDTPEFRFRFLQKMVAIAKTGKIPAWLPVDQFKKRYGERPSIEWLERVGLR